MSVFNLIVTGIPLNPPVPYIMSTRALFIESLVQLLCSKYESDPEKKGKLFSSNP